MNSIADDSLIIQTSSQCVPSTPHWFGEVALTAQHLRKQGILSAIGERVRFARRHFGHYDVIDFVAVLFGYAISGERTLEVFYQRLQPFAPAFMALFGRERLPSRSTLSRFLASLTHPSVEALRTLFLEDLLARPLNRERQTGELIDRAGSERVVFDIDGTREAARQRSLPKDCGAACSPASAGRTVRPWLHSDASVEKSSAPAPLSHKRIPPSGSARSPTQEMDATGKNCDGRSLLFSSTARLTTCQRSESCCGWTGNMAPEPFLPIWRASAM